MAKDTANFSYYLDIARRQQERMHRAESILKLAEERNRQQEAIQAKKEASLIAEILSVAGILGPALIKRGVETTIFFCSKQLPGFGCRKPKKPALVGWPIWESDDGRNHLRQFMVTPEGFLAHHDSWPLERSGMTARGMCIGQISVLNNSSTIGPGDAAIVSGLCQPDNYWGRISQISIPEALLTGLAELAVTYNLSADMFA